MSDYIKREDAIEIINSLPWTSSADQTKKKNLILLFTLYDAADVVEGVRCKDCRNWENGRCYLLRDATVEVRDNDFCSYGERAEA